MKLRAMSRLGAVSRARHRLRGKRAWLLALFVAGAIALRDSAGVLLAIMALLVLLDAAVPVPGDRWAQADERFRLLCRRRRRGARMRRLRNLGPERLDVLDDRTGWAATAPRRAVGVESIPLDSITGTVEDVQGRDLRPQLPARPVERRALAVRMARAARRRGAAADRRLPRRRAPHRSRRPPPRLGRARPRLVRDRRRGRRAAAAGHGRSRGSLSPIQREGAGLSFRAGARVETATRVSPAYARIAGADRRRPLRRARRRHRDRAAARRRQRRRRSTSGCGASAASSTRPRPSCACTAATSPPAATSSRRTRGACRRRSRTTARSCGS